jgi:hypothetical protein
MLESFFRLSAICVSGSIVSFLAAFALSGFNLEKLVPVPQAGLGGYDDYSSNKSVTVEDDVVPFLVKAGTICFVAGASGLALGSMAYLAKGSD